MHFLTVTLILISSPYTLTIDFNAPTSKPRKPMQMTRLRGLGVAAVQKASPVAQTAAQRQHQRLEWLCPQRLQRSTVFCHHLFLFQTASSNGAQMVETLRWIPVYSLNQKDGRICRESGCSLLYDAKRKYTLYLLEFLFYRRLDMTKSKIIESWRLWRLYMYTTKKSQDNFCGIDSLYPMYSICSIDREK